MTTPHHHPAAATISCGTDKRSGRLSVGRAAAAAALALAAVLAVAAPAAGADDLLADPSFENPKPRDRFGGVFKDWGGWIYEGGSTFEVGQIARTGKHSCEMVGSQGGKIRLQSKEIKLPAGRYRLKAYVRGLDIGKGRWGTPNDFTIQVDGKWHNLKKSGTFGWTPVTYVFDVPAAAEKPFRVFFGLWETGRMWVDDVSLEKVAETVAPTPTPVWGQAGKPIAPPGEIKQMVRCRSCGYRNDRSWPRCYACGHELAGPAARKLTTPPMVVFADFENGKREPFHAGKAVAEHASSGKYALRVDSKWADITPPAGRPLDFSQHDYFHFDVYNPQAKCVRVYVEVRDTQTRGYWTRVNLWTIAPPGASTVTFPTQLYVGEKSRPGRSLIRNKITRFVVSVGENGPLYFDRFRLERLDVQAVRFDTLVALDFGPAGSPVLEGFEAADSGLSYSRGRGYGWYGARLWREFDARQPEALTQDFVCPEAGAFRLDVPNGTYHVLMNVETPGAFWGEQQNYRKRRILLNGKVAAEHTMDAAAFKRRYFRNAHAEDIPGVDPFDRYLLPMSRWQRFEANVTDGRLEIGFSGANWAFCLSALIVYPQTDAEKGSRFVEWADKRRRAQFNNAFKQVVPPRTGAAKPAAGYRLFARHFMDPPNAHDGPRDGETLDAKAGLSLAAARGETSQLAFSLQPGGKVGAIDLAVSPLTGPGGKTLAPAAVRCGWLDYRVSRVTMDGSVYTVRPRYWHATPAPAAAGITRTFYLRVKTPPDAAAGTYRGTLTVRPKAAEPRTVPLAVTVLPFALAEIDDLAVGPWGCRIRLPWLGDDPETKRWNWRMYERSLEALREAGCTSFSGIPHLAARAAGGKVELDAAEADREMALARAQGFRHMVSNYGSGRRLGYQPYGSGAGPDVQAARRAGFADMKSFLSALYGAIDRHAVQSNWLPVAWNLCDEPVAAAIPPAVKNALAHREAGAGLKRTFFMGATSMRGDDPKDPHYPLVRALPIPSLNGHDEKSLAVLRQAGNRFHFYNGSDRWTYGRYMKMLVVRHEMVMRLVWHFHVCVGDPYYALDCREDDYCWFNTDAEMRLVPSMRFLAEIQPGLNDYRYLTTLQRLLAARANHPAAGEAKKTFEAMMALAAGKDRPVGAERRKAGRLAEYEADRQKVIDAIVALSK